MSSGASTRDPSADSAAPAAGSDALVSLQVGRLDDLCFSAVVRLVADYPPFRAYSMGVVIPRLMEQLAHGANVMAVQAGMLVGYAGWLRADAARAAAWQAGQAEVPPPDWAGQAAIVTVTVARHPRLLPLLVRGISHECAGLPVYRMRSFQDGRPDARRPPITGRLHRFPPV